MTLQRCNYMLEITDNHLPPTANKYKRMHWTKIKKEKEYWVSIIRGHLDRNPPPRPLDSYKLTLIRYSSVAPDYDGLVLSWKIVIDACQVAGLITNDKICNSGPWDCRWIKAKPKHGSVYIKVEENS